jgi:hypothetical protein
MYAIDHLIHFVDRTPKEAVEMMKQFGFRAVEGGSHANWGTWNSLTYFDLLYIEFLAIEHEDVARQSTNPLAKQVLQEKESGEGLCQLAIRTNDIKQTAKDLQQRGLRIADRTSGMRKRSDGSIMEWSMLFAESDEVQHSLPFFIQWKESDEERRKELTDRGMIAPHPNGVTGIQSIAYAVHNVQETVSRWTAWFNGEAGEIYTDEELQAVCQPLQFQNTVILFCEPKGNGIVKQVLEKRGERPFLVELEGRAQKTELMGSVYVL